MVGAHAERAAGNPDHVLGPPVIRLLFRPLDIGLQRRHGIHSGRARYWQ